MENENLEQQEQQEEIITKNTILIDIKKLLGLSEEDKSFDKDVIININSVFNTLSQLGVNDNYERLKTGEETWDDFYPENSEDFVELIKTYMYLKLRLIFDPPLNSSILNSFKESIRELEWRLNIVNNLETKTNYRELLENVNKILDRLTIGGGVI